MTDEWWSNIYRKAAADLSDAHIQRLVDEFKYLGNTIREKAQQAYGTPDRITTRDETSGTD